ncbi:MAG TPA: hypothetical protein GX716_02950 [Firmicutes bacterium]|jgi:hypothetical protein|nr:hypothetical protein [Candidatus Fermentithermobacillaceae bacterium]
MAKVNREYIAWTTQNLELSGPHILTIAATRKDAEETALEELNKRDIAHDIYGQTDMRNLRVWSKTRFIRHFGRRGYERAVDEYLRETAERA